MQREHVVSQLVPGKPKAQLLRAAKLIIIDQLPLLRRAHLEAVLEILDTLEFKGVLLMSGDFRQCGGVVPFAAAAQQNASPRLWAAWRYARMLSLSSTMRGLAPIAPPLPFAPLVAPPPPPPLPPPAPPLPGMPPPPPASGGRAM